MKKNYRGLIIALLCFTFMLFCCESILQAQTKRKKPAVRRTNTPPGSPEQREGKTAGAKAEISGSVNAEVDPKLQPDKEVAVLETDYGKIIIELYPVLAPRMVERFKKLIREGFYNNTTFHRTSPPLGIIQGGDPLSRDTNPANDGFGNSPYPNLPAEFSDVPFTRGIVGAARTAERDSANCQFFIMLKRQPAFDKNYTIFGRVTEGLANAYVINISPTGRGTDRPEDPVIVRRVTLQPRARLAASN